MSKTQDKKAQRLAEAAAFVTNGCAEDEVDVFDIMMTTKKRVQL